MEQTQRSTGALHTWGWRVTKKPDEAAKVTAGNVSTRRCPEIFISLVLVRYYSGTI